MNHAPFISRTESAVVVAVNGVDANGRGPGSGITYDLKVNYAGGAAADVAGVIPFRPRFPDICDTVAAPVGTAVGVIQFGRIRFYDIPEQPYIVECAAP